jgi:hypothetical protein
MVTRNGQHADLVFNLDHHHGFIAAVHLCKVCQERTERALVSIARGGSKS